MTQLKRNRAFAMAGITTPVRRAHIERNLLAAASDLQGLTSAEIAAVIKLHDKAYHEGRAAGSAESAT